MNRFEFLKKIKLPRKIKFPNKIKLPNLRRLSTRQIIFWGVTLALAVGVFVLARGLTACWRITNLPGIPPGNCAGATVNPLGTPVFNVQGTQISSAGQPATPVPVDVLPPAWDGASRINILFIGLDYRDWLANEGPPRSDTMILFTVDPLTKTAGMLSIPRDMFVNIPGYGYSRINTAYSSGEANHVPGGGAGLAMKTVEQFIGVPVNYYAQIDFNTFTSFIDYIGGVDVYVDQDLLLDVIGSGYDPIGRLNPNDTVKLLGKTRSGSWMQIEWPSSPNGKGWIPASALQTQHTKWAALPIVVEGKTAVATGTPTGTTTAITGTVAQDPVDVRKEPRNPNQIRVNCCGIRHLDGIRALAYARTRKTEGGDVDRANRQQAVIQAIQKKVFSPKVFPSLVQNATAIYQQFQSGIHTNMPLEDAIRLAVLGKDISLGSVKKGVIDYTMVEFDNVILGGQDASIFKPIPDKIRVLRDQIFTTSGPLSPMSSGDPVSQMRAEEARVRVLAPAGLEQRAGQFFASQGINVTEAGTGGGENQTIIEVYGPKLYTLRYLVATYGFSHTQIRFKPDPANSADIEIRVGNDLAGRIP
jgi:LCP family protein required for cell wall assembly